MHKTRTYTKKFEIDTAIEPIVRWLNALNQVITLCSCHGEERAKEDSEKGFVTFICLDDNALIRIHSEIVYADLYGRIRIGVFYSSGTKIYRLTFDNRSVLRAFAKSLSGPHPDIGDTIGN